LKRARVTFAPAVLIKTVRLRNCQRDEFLGTTDIAKCRTIRDGHAFLRSIKKFDADKGWLCFARGVYYWSWEVPECKMSFS
jgi:hypothetical protein